MVSNELIPLLYVFENTINAFPLKPRRPEANKAPLYPLPGEIQPLDFLVSWLWGETHLKSQTLELFD
jgi:hypothetical protein